jgi:hypothetical protein
MNAYGALLAFDTDDPTFARGFEMGRLWETLGQPLDEPLVMTFHACNIEMILRIAEARGVDAQSEDLDATWIEVTFAAPDTAGGKP